jgi:N-acetylglucosamine kinase
MQHVIGIDAGGTKTVCLLADEDGRIISRARSDGANLQSAGELHVEKILHNVMEQAIGARGIVPAAICLASSTSVAPGNGRTPYSASNSATQKLN